MDFALIPFKRERFYVASLKIWIPCRFCLGLLPMKTFYKTGENIETGCHAYTTFSTLLKKLSTIKEVHSWYFELFLIRAKFPSN